MRLTVKEKKKMLRRGETSLRTEEDPLVFLALFMKKTLFAVTQSCL